ncbi:MAG: M24 family metallopeptidase [Bacteroidetes bacterium]|nr:M24 family metallopeptidase [Bacteroidota bacterium]
MTTNFNSTLITAQKLLSEYNFDGWLLYNFRRNNEVATKILEIPTHLFQSRRYFYFIPKEGEPIKIVHSIEEFTLDHLLGNKKIYNTWQSLQETLKAALKNSKKIVMEYSPMNNIPYASKIDGGTLDLIRSFGVSVHSSANISQYFEATLNEVQQIDLFSSAKHLRTIVDIAFNFIGEKLRSNSKVTEFDVQQKISNEFELRNIYSETDPHCSVNANCANPHYEALKDNSSEIKKGDVILIDLWAKKKSENSIYADITWMGFAGKNVPAKYQEVFDVVVGARDRAVEYLNREIPNRKVTGAEVDDVSRNFINSKNYGKYFVHRTGHNLGEVIHGNGTNIDNYETQDVRELIPNSTFTIEPGVYLTGEFGVRSELNIFISEKREVIIPGLPIQKEIVLIDC